MITLQIPGRGKYLIKNVVIDFNGTLALDGILLDGIPERLHALAEILDVYVITSDTHGTVHDQLQGLPLSVTILTSDDHSGEKASFVHKLGAESVIAIGNGSNDAAMLFAAGIGLAVIQREGASIETLNQADIIFTDIVYAFEAVHNPQRLIASLRK